MNIIYTVYFLYLMCETHFHLRLFIGQCAHDYKHPRLCLWAESCAYVFMSVDWECTEKGV